MSFTELYSSFFQRNGTCRFVWEENGRFNLIKGAVLPLHKWGEVQLSRSHQLAFLAVLPLHKWGEVQIL